LFGFVDVPYSRKVSLYKKLKEGVAKLKVDNAKALGYETKKEKSWTKADLHPLRECYTLEEK
jgi:hypothetical protein